MTSLHTKDYKDLISRLKQARIKAGFTQKEIADILNKPQSYISKIESCQRRLDILELKELCKIYQVKPESFL